MYIAARHIFSVHMHTSLFHQTSCTKFNLKDNIIKNFKVATGEMKPNIGPFESQPYETAHTYMFTISGSNFTSSSLTPALAIFFFFSSSFSWCNPLPLPEGPCSIRHFLYLQYFKIMKLFFTDTSRCP